MYVYKQPYSFGHNYDNKPLLIEAEWRIHASPN